MRLHLSCACAALGIVVAMVVGSVRPGAAQPRPPAKALAGTGSLDGSVAPDASGPPAPPPLPVNCQAPLLLTEEVARLLQKAASHSTRSQACVDGPGQRVSVDQVLVCPKSRSFREVTVDATYTVVIHLEGDTRMCGQFAATDSAETIPPLCLGKPIVSHQRTVFRFNQAKGGLHIEVPKSIPGFDTLGERVVEQLAKEHDGGCYGKSGPFKPMPVKLQ